MESFHHPVQLGETLSAIYQSEIIWQQLQAKCTTYHYSQPVSTVAVLTLGTTDALQHLLSLLKLATLDETAKYNSSTPCTEALSQQRSSQHDLVTTLSRAQR